MTGIFAKQGSEESSNSATVHDAGVHLDQDMRRVHR